MTCPWLVHYLFLTYEFFSTCSWIVYSYLIPVHDLFKKISCHVYALFTTWSQVVNISFMTCSCFVHGLLIACLWLVHGLLMAYSFLAQNLEVSKFVHDIPWLGHDLIMTCSWLGHNFFISYWSLVHYLFMTCSWLISWACLMDNSFMNCSQAQFQLFSSVQVQLNTEISIRPHTPHRGEYIWAPSILSRKLKFCMEPLFNQTRYDVSILVIS